MDTAEHRSDGGRAGAPATPAQPIDALERVALYRRRRGLAQLRADELEAVADAVATAGRDPVEYVCRLFDRHQVVFLGHHTPTRQTGLFLQRLVRELPAVGVNDVALEYFCRDDQHLLDATVGAGAGAGSPSDAGAGAGNPALLGFDETPAREAMLRWGLRHGFAFREYLDIVRAAWAVNRDAAVAAAAAAASASAASSSSSVPAVPAVLPGPAPAAMRLLALDYDLDFDAVTDTADLRSRHPWHHLRHRGTAARHMCDVLQAEILDTGRKALVLTRTAHALTRFRRRPHRLWDAFDTEFDGGRVVGAGNHVYAAVADRAATVLLHQPLPADGTLCDYALAADGVVDAVFAMVDGPPAPLGFDVDVGPAAGLRCSGSLDGGTLGDLARGWVYLESDQQTEGPTPLRGAVPEGAVVRASRFALDGALRRPDVTAADFDAVFSAAASVAELSWTQVL
ncbi:MAG TPA: hypothetical protein DEP66_02690 [Acidimicrobiaceae bacterium]|nr:hypothetical protein [Acidimicrobiaceae bacterium]